MANQTYPQPGENDHDAIPHRHGWECFRTSGGFTSAMENDGGTWAEKVERIYRTAYRTGYRNGWRDRKDRKTHEFRRG